MLEADGLEVLLSVLERAILLGNDVPEVRPLRSVIVGFLLNLTISHQEKHQKVLSENFVCLLCNRKTLCLVDVIN